MQTKDFIEVLKQQKAWDIAAPMSLLGAYMVGVFLFTLVAGTTVTTNFLIGGLGVGLYSFFKPEIIAAFVSWWKHFHFGFHATLIVLELAALGIFGRNVLWSLALENKPKDYHE